MSDVGEYSFLSPVVWYCIGFWVGRAVQQYMEFTMPGEIRLCNFYT